MSCIENRSVILKMVGIKTISHAAVVMALALICAVSWADANGTLSETTTANSTDPAKTNSSENEGMSKELKICLGVAALVTVVGVGLCLFIRLKAGNSYAMGGNVPKPLGGMPDDY